MKKTLTILLLILLAITLVSCRDKKTELNYINVLFFTNTNQSQIETISGIEASSLIEEPTEPTRMGFKFSGWFKDVNLTSEWIFATDKIADKSIVLYAKWEPGFFSVGYELNGGEMAANFKYLEDYPEDQRDPETNPELLKYLFFKVGQSNTIPRPSKYGYTFKSFYLYDEYEWEGAPEDTDQSYKPGDAGYKRIPSELSRDLILYAHWDAVKNSINFRSNYPVEGVLAQNHYRNRTFTFGQEFMYDTDYTDESLINRLPDFTNLDTSSFEYEFIGWNDQIDGEGNWYGVGNEATTAPVNTYMNNQQLSRLYGQWRKI